MSEEKLHSSIKEFKSFINNHPLLLREIRRSGNPLQEYYEKWILYGPNDSIWDEYKDVKTESKAEGKIDTKTNYTELFGNLMKYTEQIDLDKVQKQMKQFNSTIQTIQKMLNGFIESKSVTPNPKGQAERFNLFRD